jgi:hypothetical protein
MGFGPWTLDLGVCFFGSGAFYSPVLRAGLCWRRAKAGVLGVITCAPQVQNLI